MRNLLIIFLLFFSLTVYSQNTSNRFAGENTDSETENPYSNSQKLTSDVKASSASAMADNGPGAPGEPVPIDGFLPLLIVVAVGLIFFQNRYPSQKTMSN